MMVAKSLVTTQVYVACASGNIREPILGVGPKSSSEVITHPHFLGRRYLGRQAKVSRMVWKGFAPLSLAVSTVVLTSASAFAAHMAR